ncbi:MAG: winged helix-turn-helix domain-containing protein [Phycisphaerales bacterium]|nr:winged helix-turn-helix domain-containing protein [Phycisphaerales bacterium]
MNNLDERILNAIQAKPGQKAKDIAAQLGIDRQLVNSALWGRLKGRVQQDKAYRWYPKGSSGIDNREPNRLDTPLAKICRYYLDCLSHDDVGGVSEFASSMYGPPGYVELASLPMFDQTGMDPFDSEGGRKLLRRVRSDKNRQAIFLGYPVRLNSIRSRKSNWVGLKVEPILLFPFQDVDSKYARPTLGDDLPQINFQALRSLSNAGVTSLMEEAILLAEELGLGNAAGEQPTWMSCSHDCGKYQTVWDWQDGYRPLCLERRRGTG